MFHVPSTFPALVDPIANQRQSIFYCCQRLFTASTLANCPKSFSRVQRIGSTTRLGLALPGRADLRLSVDPRIRKHRLTEPNPDPQFHHLQCFCVFWYPLMSAVYIRHQPASEQHPHPNRPRKRGHLNLHFCCGVRPPDVLELS